MSSRSSWLLLAGYIKRLSRNLGLDVGFAKNSLDRVRSEWLERLDIGLVIDAGANVGQYAKRVFETGYSGRIISIEPLPDVFSDLLARSANNPQWSCFPVALGADDGDASILVSTNRVSSSILEVSPIHQDVAPGGKQTGSVVVPVRRLDTLWEDIPILGGTEFLLKLDLQGFELEALKGAAGVMSACELVECELSLDSLYSGQPLIEDLIGHLSAEGFRPIWLERGLTDHKRRRTLQVDALFAR